MGQSHTQPPWPRALPRPVLDSTPPFPKAASTSHQPSAGEAGTRRGRPARHGAGVGTAGPWKLWQGLWSTRSWCSGTQAWGLTRRRRKRRRRHQSWSLPIPGGPRTLWGESRRGLGTRHLRPEAGKSLPLEVPRWGRRTDTPMLGSAPGTFWVNGERSRAAAPDLQVSTNQSEVPSQLLCQRPHPHPGAGGTCWAGWSLATPGWALLLKPASPPPASLLPSSALPLQPPPPPDSSLAVVLPQAPSNPPVSSTLCQEALLLGRRVLLSQGRPDLLGNIPWVLSGLLVVPLPQPRLRTPLWAGARLAGCPGPGPAWLPPCCCLPSASLWPRGNSTPAVILQEAWARQPPGPAGIPTTLACTTMAPSSALQVRAGSCSGEGGPGALGPGRSPRQSLPCRSHVLPPGPGAARRRGQRRGRGSGSSSVSGGGPPSRHRAR